MIIKDLNEYEKILVGKSLKAIVSGPYIENDDEFECLMHKTRKEVDEIELNWPRTNPNDLDALRTIKLCLLNLLGYPHGEEEALLKFLRCDEAELENLLSKFEIIVRCIASREISKNVD